MGSAGRCGGESRRLGGARWRACHSAARSRPNTTHCMLRTANATRPRTRLIRHTCTTGVQQRTRKFEKSVGSKGGSPYAAASRLLVAPSSLPAPIPNTLIVIPVTPMNDSLSATRGRAAQNKVVRWFSPLPHCPTTLIDSWRTLDLVKRCQGWGWATPSRSPSSIFANDDTRPTFVIAAPVRGC